MHGKNQGSDYCGRCDNDGKYGNDTFLARKGGRIF